MVRGRLSTDTDNKQLTIDHKTDSSKEKTTSSISDLLSPHPHSIDRLPVLTTLDIPATYLFLSPPSTVAALRCDTSKA